MGQMKITELLLAVGLIVLGGAILSTNFHPDFSNYQWLGWVPLLAGLGFIVARIIGKM